MLHKRQWGMKQSEIIGAFDDPAPTVFLRGASGSGKTAVAIARFLLWSWSYEGVEFGLIAKTKKQSLNVIGSEIRRFCGEYRIPIRQTDGAYLINGNRYHFLDGADISARERIQGFNFAGVYIDEVVNINSKVFEEIDQRVRSVEDGKLFMTANPTGHGHWFKRDYVDRADEIGMVEYRLFHSDNPGMSASASERMAAMARHDQSLYRRRIEGEWANATGAIYPFFTVADAPDKASILRWYVSIDPADSGTTHALLIGGASVDGEMHYHIFEERVFDARQTGKRHTHSEQVRRLKQAFGDISITAIACDSAAQGFITELKQQFRVPVYGSEKSDVYDGIVQTGYVLNRNLLTIDRRCRALRSELDGYHWDEKAAVEGIDKPIKMRDHGLDAMRYFVMTLMMTGGRRNEWNIVYA